MNKTRLRRLLRPLLPSRIRAHRILSGQLRGRYLVTSWRDYPAGIGGYTEPLLLAWFRRNVARGECWLDIGAQYGYTALALCEQVGQEGRVWAFEPVSETAGHLSRTARLNQLTQLTVVPTALGAPETLALTTVAVVRGMAESTLALPPCPTSILVARLDWLWPRLNATPCRIDGVKIDVQGMELEVLTGMKKILSSDRPVVVLELHAGVDRLALLSLFRSAGYSRAGEPIEPLPGESEPLYVDDRSYVFWPDART